MVAIRVNGEEVNVQHSAQARFTEVVELIKSVIDPDHIITDIRIDGCEVSDNQWQGSVSQMGTSIIEVDTGGSAEYVAQRMAATPEIIDEIFLLFRQARKSFQNSNSADGNRGLVEAVKAAKAFFEWYSSMLQLLPGSQKDSYNIEQQVKEIAEVCQKICTQQLYQNWKAVADTIEKDLEPKLDSLESFSRKFKSAQKAA